MRASSDRCGRRGSAVWWLRRPPAAHASAVRPVPVPVPAAGRPVDTSHPSRVVGRGTPASCTSAAVVAAVRAGGIIRFSCGPKPVTIRMNATAKVVNTSREVVLDGGGLVTLSGEGRRRILYMDTCDPAQKWTTSHCEDQATPRLVVQNIAFRDGNSTGAGLRRRRRRGDLRPRRAPAHRRLRVHFNRCEHDRARHRRGGRPGAVAVPRPSGVRRGQPLHRQRVQQRRRAEQHRRLVDGAELPLHRQPRDRQRRQPGAATARRAAAAAARSTTTATG